MKLPEKRAVTVLFVSGPSDGCCAPHTGGYAGQRRGRALVGVRCPRLSVYSLWLPKLTLGCSYYLWISKGSLSRFCKGRIVFLYREGQFYIKKVKQICVWQMDRSYKRPRGKHPALCAVVMAYNLDMGDVSVSMWLMPCTGSWTSMRVAPPLLLSNLLFKPSVLEQGF